MTDFRALEKAAAVMVGDYQTSENHHPHHVLVPLAAFEALRSALDGDGALMPGPKPLSEIDEWNYLQMGAN